MNDPINLNPSRPVAKLREAGVIKNSALSCFHQEVRFLYRPTAGGEREIAADRVFGTVHENLMPFHWFKNLDLNGSDLVGLCSILRSPSGRMQRDLFFAIDDDRERSISDMPIRVET